MRKKVLAVLLVLALTFTVAVPTLSIAADPTGSITIKNAIEDKSFKVFKVLDIKYSGTGESKAYTYTLDNDWVNFFIGETAPGKEFLTLTYESGLQQLRYNNKTYYININETNVAAFVNKAQEYALTTPVTVDGSGTVTKGATSVKIDNLALGYYLVYPEDAKMKAGASTICSLTMMDSDVDVNVKADYPGFEKEVDDQDVEVGQIVTYTITSAVPDTTGYKTYPFVFTDKMTEGLTFNAEIANFTVKIDGTAISVPDTGKGTTLEIKDNGFTLTFDMTKYQNNKGNTLEIIYKAKVNKNAICNYTENHADLEYGHTPTVVPPQNIPVYSSKIVVFKHKEGDESVQLSGAKFVLIKKGEGGAESYFKTDATSGDVSWVAKDSKGAIDSVEKAQTYGVNIGTTDSNGECTFEGLESGTYYLREIESPVGYNLLTTDVTVNVRAPNSDNPDKPVGVSVTSKVANSSGGTLPETGGMGTTIFYLLGGLLVVGAVVAFITRRRMSADN